MYTDTVNTHLLLVRVRFVCAQKHAHQAYKINQNVVFSARSLFLMISNNIQFLGGIGWSLISPTDSNKWKQDCARLLAKITFWHRYCRVLLKALWSCWWWGGMSLSDEMKRSPSENWLFFLFLAISPRFQSPSPTSLLLPKKRIASLVTVSLRFQGAATIQLLCLPPPNVSMKMQPDGDTFSLSEPLCSFGGASPSALFFFPQTIHVGGLENKTEEWEDPCEYTG